MYAFIYYNVCFHFSNADVAQSVRSVNQDQGWLIIYYLVRDKTNKLSLSLAAPVMYFLT